MKKSRLSLWIVVLALVITGIILKWMAPATEDDFPHPLNGLLRELHGLSAALGLMIFGYMLADHVQKKLAKHKHYWDGYVHLSLWLLLITSGLLLYYPQEIFEDLGLSVSALHWYLGLFLCGLFPLHFWRKNIKRQWLKYRFNSQQTNP